MITIHRNGLIVDPVEPHADPFVRPGHQEIRFCKRREGTGHPETRGLVTGGAIHFEKLMANLIPYFQWEIRDGGACGNVALVGNGSTRLIQFVFYLAGIDHLVSSSCDHQLRHRTLVKSTEDRM